MNQNGDDVKHDYRAFGVDDAVVTDQCCTLCQVAYVLSLLQYNREPTTTARNFWSLTASEPLRQNER